MNYEAHFLRPLWKVHRPCPEFYPGQKTAILRQTKKKTGSSANQMRDAPPAFMGVHILLARFLRSFGIVAAAALHY